MNRLPPLAVAAGLLAFAVAAAADNEEFGDCCDRPVLQQCATMSSAAQACCGNYGLGKFRCAGKELQLPPEGETFAPPADAAASRQRVARAQALLQQAPGRFQAAAVKAEGLMGASTADLAKERAYFPVHNTVTNEVLPAFQDYKRLAEQDPSAAPQLLADEDLFVETTGKFVGICIYYNEKRNLDVSECIERAREFSASLATPAKADRITGKAVAARKDMDARAALERRSMGQQVGDSVKRFTDRIRLP